MNSQMTTNSQLSTTESTKKTKIKTKTKLSKQIEEEQSHRNGDHMKGYQWGVERENGGKGTGNKKHK